MRPPGTLHELRALAAQARTEFRAVPSTIYRDAPSLAAVLAAGNDSSQLEFLSLALCWGAAAPAFVLTHGLAAALALTDCRRVPVLDVHWPFQTFAVVMPPDNELRFREHKNGIDECVSVVFLHHWHVPRFDSALGHSTGPSRPVLLVRAYCPSGLSVVSRLPAERAADSTVGRWCGETEANLPDRYQGVRARMGEMPLSKMDAANLARVLRMVVNVALYLAERPHEWTAPRWWKRRAKIGEHGAHRTHLIGRAVKIAPMLQTLHAQARKAGNLWRVDVRFLVRGHWRNQPFGAGRVLRRRIWIMPFWKGPDTAHVPIRDYNVQD